MHIDQLGDKQYKKLKRLYATAISLKHNQLEFEHAPYITEFVKYWLEACDNYRTHNKLRIWNGKTWTNGARADYKNTFVSTINEDFQKICVV
jgi:hypothetical protein